MNRKAQSTQDEFTIVSSSVEETRAFGETLGRALHPGDVVALRGELGSGKTTLIQGLVKGLGGDPERVKSPTFVLMREYPLPLEPRGDVARPTAEPRESRTLSRGVIHIDGYRLAGAPSIAWLDLDLLFAPEKITVVEWAERFEGLLPEAAVELRLAHVSANRRRITLTGTRPRGRDMIAAFQKQGDGETHGAARD